MNNIWRSSDIDSHEFTLTSNYDGPFNYVTGFFYGKGEDPYSQWRIEKSAYRPGLQGQSATAARQYQFLESNCTNDLLEARGLPLLDANKDGTISTAEQQATRTTDDGATGNNYHYYCPGDFPEVMNAGSQAPTGSNIQGLFAVSGETPAWETTAFYVNTTYRLSDEWNFFAGIRHDSTEKALIEASSHQTYDARSGGDGMNYYTRYQDSSANPSCPCAGTTWDDTTWNIGAEYTPRDDFMVYGRISKGARAGGFGLRWTPTDSEELINYEAGIKGLFFDGRLQLATSAFLQDFDKWWVFNPGGNPLPQSAIEPGERPFAGVVETIPGTEISGIEVEAAWRITDDLTLRGFYNYLDSSVGSFNALYTVDRAPDDVSVAPIVDYTYVDNAGNTAVFSGRVFDPKGNQLPNQPEHKYSLTLIYNTPLPIEWGQLELNTTYSFIGHKWMDFANVPRSAIPEYTRWDVRAIWRSPDSKWSVTGYVRNALDQNAVQLWSRVDGVTGPQGTMVHPREVGMSVLWQAF